MWGRVNPETTPHQRQSQTSEFALTWMQAAYAGSQALFDAGGSNLCLTLQAFAHGGVSWRPAPRSFKLGTLQMKVVNRVIYCRKTVTK